METIRLYPSNWLYNAGVVGLLRVCSDIGRFKIEEWLEDDGTVKVDMKIFKNSQALKWFYKYHNDKPPIIGNSIYKNFINPSRKQKDENSLRKFVELLYRNLIFNNNNDNSCRLCGSKLAFNKIDKEIEEFLSTRQIFNMMHSQLLAPSLGDMPNSFWSCNNDFYLCPLCIYLIIHHHISLIPTNDGKIFINAPSFKMIWFLNKFASEVLDKWKEYSVRRILGLSLIEFSQRIYATFGTWTMMNIEMVIIRSGKIDSYSLPIDVTRILLNPKISSLISRTGEPMILDIVLKRDYKQLLVISQKILKYSIGGSNSFDDKYLSALVNKDRRSLNNLSLILPELYTRIETLNKRGEL
jgi:CRISPR-associated protein Cst1